MISSPVARVFFMISSKALLLQRLLSWIPAFAGMTALGFLFQEQYKDEDHQG
jgi:uncharacterized membrane protein YpjA